jgi:hypothetical protein
MLAALAAIEELILCFPNKHCLKCISFFDNASNGDMQGWNKSEGEGR